MGKILPKNSLEKEINKQIKIQIYEKFSLENYVYTFKNKHQALI